MASLDQIYALLQQVEQDVLNLPQQMQLAAHTVMTYGAGLSGIDSYLGLVTAGEFRTGNGKQPGKGFSGVRIAFPPMVYNSTNWNIAGVNNDVLEFGVRATDGVALAGAGAVVIDHNGITMANNLARMKFLALNGTDFATIWVSNLNVWNFDDRIPGSTFGLQAVDALGNTGNMSLGEDAALASRFLAKLTRFSGTSAGTAFSMGGASTSNVFAVRTTPYASGIEVPFIFHPEAFTNLTASTEVIDVSFDLSHTVQHATGLLVEQNAFKIGRPTYSFVGASTITKAATLTVVGAPLAGTFATLTNAYALWVQSGTAQLDGGVVTTTLTATSIAALAALTVTTLTVNEIDAPAAANLLIKVPTAAKEFQIQVATTAGLPSALLYREDPAKANRLQFYIPPGNAVGAKFTVDSVSATGFEVITDKLTSGLATFMTVQPDTYTNLTTLTENIDVNFNLSHNVQHATGAITLQRAMYIQAPTYSFVGASTITTAVTLEIDKAPVAGTNATITNAYALRVQGGAVSFAGSLTTDSLNVGSASGASSGQIRSTGAFTTNEFGIVVTLTGTLTNDFPTGLKILHTSSATPAAGFGSEIRFHAQTNGNGDRAQFLIYPQWVDSTDASRKSRTQFFAEDTTDRECLRLEASGAAAMVGFYGHAAVVQPAAPVTLADVIAIIRGNGLSA